MSFSFRTMLIPAAFVVVSAIAVPPCSAAGRIDAKTLIAIPHGTFDGVAYVRYEAMFDGVSSNKRPYRVPCQIIAARRTARRPVPAQ